MPLFLVSLLLTGANLNYATPVSAFIFPLDKSISCFLLQGKSKGAKEVLKRIDYGGTATLFATVRHKDHIFFSVLELIK